jgi:small subunit ribosomal protein S3
MGQKVNPIGIRVGINRIWDSVWIGKRDYATHLHQDIAIRNYIFSQLAAAGVARVIIERPDKKAILTVHAARPWVLIGKKGSDIEKLKQVVCKITQGEVVINVVEVRKPEIDARLIAESIAQQIEKRVSFRRAMKRAMQSALKLGAQGIRVNCSGRLAGAEIARMEWYREGRVPLHTLKADVDFGLGVAKTTYGTCGVKVWVYKGEQIGYGKDAQEKSQDKLALERKRRVEEAAKNAAAESAGGDFRRRRSAEGSAAGGSERDGGRFTRGGADDSGAKKRRFGGGFADDRGPQGGGSGGFGSRRGDGAGRDGAGRGFAGYGRGDGARAEQGGGPRSGGSGFAGTDRRDNAAGPIGRDNSLRERPPRTGFRGGGAGDGAGAGAGPNRQRRDGDRGGGVRPAGSYTRTDQKPRRRIIVTERKPAPEGAAAEASADNSGSKTPVVE